VTRDVGIPEIDGTSKTATPENARTSKTRRRRASRRVARASRHSFGRFDARAVEESPLPRLPAARRPSVETLAMPLKTRVTELLKIEHLIVQGGMHHV